MAKYLVLHTYTNAMFILGDEALNNPDYSYWIRIIDEVDNISHWAVMGQFEDAWVTRALSIVFIRKSAKNGALTPYRGKGITGFVPQ